MAPPRFRILIIGGGVAGPALAHFLTHNDALAHALDITIIERAPALRASGQQIDVRGPALDALERTGLAARMRAVRVPELGLAVIDPRGRLRLTHTAAGRGESARLFTAELEMMRADLVRLLHGATALHPRVRFLFGHTAARLAQRHDAPVVDVTFAPAARTEPFDLVVGADGQASPTRAMLFGPAAAAAHFRPLGMHIAYCSVPRTPLPGEPAAAVPTGPAPYAVLFPAPPRRQVLVRADNAATMQVYLGVMDDHAAAGRIAASLGRPPAEQKALWAALFADCPWRGPELARGVAAAADGDFYAHALGQVRAPRLAAGRVVLLGDAAGCPSPVTGKGTTAAVAAAYVLAGEVAGVVLAARREAGRDVDVEGALARYEAAVAPLVRETQKLWPGLPGLLCPPTPWRAWLVTTLLWLLLVLRVDRLLSVVFKDEAIPGWKLPEYPALALPGGGQ